MPHALLLSPDDQAVSAITGVLEEMSVTCERPLDGVSAAQKLNSQTFDLVLVDCENLPAAKLIFDVCRRGKSGNNPVPIAIVDGRAGLPTAFRLGAELILTKPVAKDQARSTIRTAVGRVRKEVTSNENAAAPSASASVTEECTLAATAGVSSQLTSFTEPASQASMPTDSWAATLAAPALSATTHSSVDELDATAVSKVNRYTKSLSASSSLLDLPADSVNAKLLRSLKPSDDPVLANLESAEPQESTKSQAVTSPASRTTLVKPIAKSAAPPPSSYRHAGNKSRVPLLALLMLMLAVAGFYAAWTYQPGFRDIAQPRIDRVLNLAGAALPPTKSTSSDKPSAQVAKTLAPVSESLATPSQSPVANSATASATTATLAASAPAEATTVPAAITQTTEATNAAVPPVSTSETGKASDSKPTESKKDIAASPFDAQLPGNRTVILSSKGAGKRLVHSVQPTYPADAHATDAQGTVVLKTLVDANGEVENVRLLDGNAALATAAMQAVKQWRYRPYVRDGKTQAFQTVVIVDFQRP